MKNPHEADSLTPALSGEDPAWRALSPLLALTGWPPGLPSWGLVGCSFQKQASPGAAEGNAAIPSSLWQAKSPDVYIFGMWEETKVPGPLGAESLWFLARFMVCSIPGGGRCWARKNPGFGLRESLATCEAASHKPGLNEQLLFHN